MTDEEKRAAREAFIAEAKAKYEQAKLDWKNLYESKKDCEFLDEDGYPTNDALHLIEEWHFSDPKGFFAFIESIWHLRSWGWTEGVGEHDWDKDKEVYRYNISTAGWSGNESIIKSMQKNEMMWFLNWVQSRRGGHYIFEVNEFDDE
jgi:hypothetical protein